MHLHIVLAALSCSIPSSCVTSIATRARTDMIGLQDPRTKSIAYCPESNPIPNNASGPLSNADHAVQYSVRQLKMYHPCK